MKEYNVGTKHGKSARNNFAEKYSIDGKPNIFPNEFFKEKAPQIKTFLRYHRNIKVRFLMTCIMETYVIDKISRIYRQNKAYFNTETFESMDVKEILSQMIKQILNKIQYYQHKGSGWYFKEVLSLEIHTVSYKPVKGSCYIPLPDFIKKCIVNLENKDDKCFQWCILRYLYPLHKQATRINDLKKYEDELNFKGIDFPIKLKDITKFENQNPSIPGVNVFSVNENKKIYPLRLNQNDCQKSIHLFLFEQDGKSHYSLIKNFWRLTRSQITSDTNSKIHICKRCLLHFTKEELFENHITYCSVFGKTIENIRKRQMVFLIDNKKTTNKLSSKPNFESCTIFDENLIACDMKKTEVYFNKPIYVGQAILDLSRTLMLIFIIIISEKNMGTKLNYYLQILVA